MQHVKMLEDRKVTVDGVNTIDAAEGQVYPMGDGVAASLIASGAAEPVDAGDMAELENKDQGAADEGKGKKQPRRARRPKAVAAPPEATDESQPEA